MKAATAGFGLLAIVLILGSFLLTGWLLMVFVNVVLGHYDIKLLDYTTALAINALAWLGYLGGNVRGKD